jgi:uncharacterized membrane protein
MLLAFITPRINEMIDKSVISHTTESLNGINEQVMDVMTSTGQQREILFSIKKGEYTFDCSNKTIFYTLKNSNYKYSEPNVSFKQGEILVLTKDNGAKKYDIILLLNYSSFNLTFTNQQIVKHLTSSPVEYTLVIQNKGDKQINFETR